MADIYDVLRQAQARSAQETPGAAAIPAMPQINVRAGVPVMGLMDAILGAGAPQAPPEPSAPPAPTPPPSVPEAPAEAPSAPPTPTPLPPQSKAPGTFAPLAATGFTPEQTAFLQSISQPESSGDYGVMYSPPGGGLRTFSDYSKHPRQYAITPEGLRSSAAGRYQITAQTWDDFYKNAQNAGFTPAEQDRAAWTIAEKTYAQRTGRNLAQDLAAGTPADRARISAAVAPRWKGVASPDFWNLYSRALGNALINVQQPYLDTIAPTNLPKVPNANK